jgi:uncharacterized protein with NAD-binding domain and iron-sulfur cluster
VARVEQPPTNSRLPGSGGKVTFWQAARAALAWATKLGDEIFHDFEPLAEEAGLKRKTDLATRARNTLEDLGADLSEIPGETVHDLLALAYKLVETRVRQPETQAPRHDHENLLARLMRELKEPWDALYDAAMDDPRIRYSFMAVDFTRAAIFGILQEVLPRGTFDHLDNEEFRAWLKRHGASDVTLESAPWITGLYDLAFAFEEGDTEKPNVAAGAALKSLINIGFNYNGAMIWKMQAGMGDAVFGPLYEVLHKRGVDIRFFQRVRRLGLDPHGGSVGEIDVEPQVELSGAGYDPFVDVEGLQCWPSEPKWEQIENGAAVRRKLRRLGQTLESEDFSQGLPVRTLRLGKDFDEVVLAISAPSLEPICKELKDDSANPRFGEMLARTNHVATQAFQLWLNEPLGELGWGHGGDPITTGYVEPYDTYSDMTHLCERERWRGAVSSIAYFCGPMHDREVRTQREANDEACENALTHVREHVSSFWPKAKKNGDFDWELLVAPPRQAGSERFKSQYWCANQFGSARYVTTQAGTVKYRLRPDESGYQNLFLAGDWTVPASTAAAWRPP